MPDRPASLLSVYVLPGPAMDPLPVVEQTRAAEQLGLGAAWISELQGPLKDAGMLCGYMGAVTTTTHIGTSITHFGTRHPMVLASWGATAQTMTGGRFLFGFGRSGPSRWINWGTPIPNIEYMADFAMILRRLWKKETFAYHGPAGTFPQLGFDVHGSDFPDLVAPPLLLAAIGPRTLELAGRCFDGALLHPFLTEDAVGRARAIVRGAAERAGRDPDALTVYHQVVVAPDLDDDGVMEAVYRRAAAYLYQPAYGNLIVTANQWNADRFDEFRNAAADAIRDNVAAGSPLKNRDVFTVPSRLLPAEVVDDAALVGTSAECARGLHSLFDAGADEIVLHGATAEHLGPLVRSFVDA